MSVFLDSAREISQLAAQHDAVLVAFSGGKDSLAVMDLCRRAFKRVAGFFMAFVPGLRCDDERLAIAVSWGVEVRHYPHWGFLDCLRSGVYCNNGAAHDRIPKLAHFDIYRIASADFGIPLIVTGMKASDSASRRKNLVRRLTKETIRHPISQWRDFDVMAYLQLHAIPLPPSPKGRRSAGVDLKGESLVWLYENYPDDFEKVCQWFPYAEAVIHRERLYFGYTQPIREVGPGGDPPKPAEERTLQPAANHGKSPAEAPRQHQTGRPARRHRVEPA